MFSSLKTKISALGLSFLLVIIISFSIFYTNNERSIDLITQENYNILKEQTEDRVKDLTMSMADALGNLVKNAKSNEEKIAIIADAIETFRFENDKSGYFYSYQRTINVAHPVRKDLLGKDLKDAKDADGVAYVSDLYKAAKMGGGLCKF
ncbi:hypothetical protein FMM56_07790 [Campylobacter sp. LR264d]|uniref:cache domain-containing protein n=1 Tax=unclassified Campylobacter TaxID=2593542 RepID=UPI001237E92D|nr:MULTISPECIES: cache domain-containing protein [unclassified Campylobacter]KAA6224579.1 hypothetical protein FMM54_08310 [Campylobacter sp. LR185c]KAA6229611.1 hypothetical protein FMM56_07790 [Campylobacter sp. LR264d]KAA8603251.1 hypothetical protein CGP82_08135 [Campylobacter sp. LR185c]